jgi:hypothetical protein
MSNIVPYQDIEKMALAVAKSGLFGVKTADQAMALMLVAQAEGRHPALAARDYDIIQNRPAKKSEAMMRDFLESGGKVEWHQLDDKVADASFSHPSGGMVRIAWDMDRAKLAGLGGKDMWKKWPRQMLRARCTSEGIRTVCPMATSGMYVPEEVKDFGPDRVEKNITPTSGAVDRVEPEQVSKLNELAVSMQEMCDAGKYEDAVLTVENEALDADAMTYLWTQFDSATRRELKKASKAIKERYAEKTITSPVDESSTTVIQSAMEEEKVSDAQVKRLEAIIGKNKLTRDDIKLKCSETWNAEHFKDLTKAQYKELDEYLAGIIEFNAQGEGEI